MVQLTLGSYSDQETSEVSRTYASVFNLSVVFSYKPRDFKDSFCFGLSVEHELERASLRENVFAPSLLEPTSSFLLLLLPLFFPRRNSKPKPLGL
ncbi:hypothetical protein VNO77_03520 [Canavalia gladiata]|uniref:Uncharacterized protein n=1 Tax=Canavalia gladiata TaxID=3824 RepID=A0AAN9MUW0_CANGL